MTKTSQFSDMTSTLNIFDVLLLLLSILVKFKSKFHVNTITGSGIVTIFFYKGLTRNPEIGNNPVWVLHNKWRLGQVMDTKFGTNVSRRMLLNDAKFQSYSFYCFWVIKGKPSAGSGGGGGGVLPFLSSPPPRLGLKEICAPKRKK